MKGELEPIDLDPYIKGEKKMGCTCSVCHEKKDMTEDFIMIETQNNLRKQSPHYNPACDELIFHSWTCKDCKAKENK